MESVTEIVSFSHDGIRRMWYPFSAKLDSNSTIISAENFYEIGELMMLIKSMFATIIRQKWFQNPTSMVLENF